MRNCFLCSHQQAAIIAGEAREYLTPCGSCEKYSSFENKYCSTCEYGDMTGDDDNPPCSECGEDYHLYKERTEG